MKIIATLTNEEIQAINETTLETTTELKNIGMVNEATSELLKNGDVIDTGAIKIARNQNVIDIDIESKFVFWCLKFATKISKLVKVVYDMFSGLFEDIVDGDYFRDEVIHYNVIEETSDDRKARYRSMTIDVFKRLKSKIKACGANLQNPEAALEVLRDLSEIREYMNINGETYWKEAVDVINLLEMKINARASLDPDLWEELWSNINTFIIDNQD